MELVISPVGQIRCLYDEALDLTAFGPTTIVRASHVEPTSEGQWMADLSPMNGPQLGPFPTLSAALQAEVNWLRQHWLLPAD